MICQGLRIEFVATSNIKSRASCTRAWKIQAEALCAIGIIQLPHDPLRLQVEARPVKESQFMVIGVHSWNDVRLRLPRHNIVLK